MQTKHTHETTPSDQDLPVATPARQALRILRNTCYVSAIGGPVLLLAALLLNVLSFFGVVHVSVRFAFFKNTGISLALCLLLAKAAQLLYGGQRFHMLADRPSQHRTIRLWGLVLSFFASLAALCSSIVSYDAALSVPLVKATLVMNGIALVCNAFNTVIQSLFARENPAGLAETADAPIQFTVLWNAVNLWGWLMVLGKVVFA